MQCVRRNRFSCPQKHALGFSGFDMLYQMRAMIANGAIGDVTMVDLRYAHGFNGDPTMSVEAGLETSIDALKATISK